MDGPVAADGVQIPVWSGGQQTQRREMDEEACATVVSARLLGFTGASSEKQPGDR